MTLNGVLFPAFIVCHVTLALEPEPFASESFEDSSITQARTCCPSLFLKP
nr:MAG TPA: hypothetical protein [Caudoviricetes sp.]